MWKTPQQGNSRFCLWGVAGSPARRGCAGIAVFAMEAKAKAFPLSECGQGSQPCANRSGGGFNRSRDPRLLIQHSGDREGLRRSRLHTRPPSRSTQNTSRKHAPLAAPALAARRPPGCPSTTQCFARDRMRATGAHVIERQLHQPEVPAALAFSLAAAGASPWRGAAQWGDQRRRGPVGAPLRGAAGGRERRRNRRGFFSVP
jgi:hypothetical protein